MLTNLEVVTNRFIWGISPKLYVISRTCQPDSQRGLKKLIHERCAIVIKYDGDYKPSLDIYLKPIIFRAS
jgi:hypothetical protein